MRKIINHLIEEKVEYFNDDYSCGFFKTILKYAIYITIFWVLLFVCWGTNK